MRRFMRFASVVALALVGMSATVSAGSAARPFTGTLYGQIDVAPASECPLGIKTVSDAIGTLTHLGRTVMHSEHCTPAGPENPHGEMTLVAANGDTVQIVYNGFAPYPAPTDESIHGEGDLLIVGGTGRFDGATGGQFDADRTTSNYVAEIEFPGYLPGGGFPLPLPAVWEVGPATIGY